ncbi:hypothetical protein [Sphingobium sp.]|uniref:hypothetical protein n=2 Tax=Sphingomonadaceae TaxID=41297 RepID=UPI0025802795|nr:hypothetical protein [Sphingobium sp.]MBR2269618.1 hypothetical protein [Sphingobium sp.]
MSKTNNFFVKYQESRFVEEKARVRLIEQLRHGYSNEARDLAHRMSICGDRRETSDNSIYCRQPACPRCKRAYARNQARAIQDWMADAQRSDLSLVTVLLGVADRAGDVPRMWKKGREALRNRVKAMRDADDRWDNVRLVGWLEADPYEAEQVELMQPRMRSYLEAKGPILFGNEVGWIVHVHLIVHHPRIDWQQVRDALQRQWPDVHAVDVQPFDQPKYDGQTTDIALYAITMYALKSTVGRTLYGEQDKAVDVYPSSWMADLHTVLYSHGSGYKSWRVRMDAAGSRSTDMHDGDVDHHLLADHACNHAVPSCNSHDDEMDDLLASMW